MVTDGKVTAVGGADGGAPGDVRAPRLEAAATPPAAAPPIRIARIVHLLRDGPILIWGRTAVVVGSLVRFAVAVGSVKYWAETVPERASPLLAVIRICMGPGSRFQRMPRMATLPSAPAEATSVRNPV